MIYSRFASGSLIFKFITWLFPVSLDDTIELDNEVRLIDVFIEHLDPENPGFHVDHGKTEGPHTIRPTCRSFSFMAT
jgi:hypothetical protein